MEMKEELEGFAEQPREGHNLGSGYSFRKPERVIVCGMGGSLLAGRLLRDAVDVPLLLVNGYSVPRISSRDLVFVCSYSGNTEETVQAYRKAKRKTKNLLVITSGGLLSREKNKILLPPGRLPRNTTGYFFFSMARVMENSGIKVGYNLGNVEGAVRAVDRKAAKRLARDMKKKTPLVYTTPPYYSAAYKIKISVNENAKTYCGINVFPELNHNEINIYRKGEMEKFLAILLRHSGESVGERRQIEAAKGIIRNWREVWLEGRDYISRLFYAVHFGDWMSYYLARYKGVDPEKTENIEIIKKRIRVSPS